MANDVTHRSSTSRIGRDELPMEGGILITNPIPLMIGRDATANPFGILRPHRRTIASVIR